MSEQTKCAGNCDECIKPCVFEAQRELRAERDQLRAESLGRLRELDRLAAEKVELWKRAENAEAERDQLRAELEQTRDTMRDLNRRTQLAESLFADFENAARIRYGHEPPPGYKGVYAAAKLKDDLDAARAELERERVISSGLREDRDGIVRNWRECERERNEAQDECVQQCAIVERTGAQLDTARARVEKLESALRAIAAPRYGLDMSDPTQDICQYWTDRAKECREIARRALEGK